MKSSTTSSSIGSVPVSKSAPATPLPIEERSTFDDNQFVTEIDDERQRSQQRAYEIWESHGRPAGTAARDWTQAEAEIRATPQ